MHHAPSIFDAAQCTESARRYFDKDVFREGAENRTRGTCAPLQLWLP